MLALSLASCTKPSERTATVRFRVGVESGVIPSIRSFSSSLSDAFASSAPSGPFKLEAVSSDNPIRSYSVTTGEAVTMAVGPYTVTGSGKGNEVAPVRNGVVTDSPAWSLSASVDVSDAVGEYSLPASYRSIALAFDLSEVSKVVFHNGSQDTEVKSFPGNGEVGVLYASNTPGMMWMPAVPLSVTVYPVDSALGEPVLYNLIGVNLPEDGIFVEYGKWYRLSPGRVSVVSGTMGVGFPEWEAGQE